jgi:hypothetical protein
MIEVIQRRVSVLAAYEKEISLLTFNEKISFRQMPSYCSKRKGRVAEHHDAVLAESPRDRERISRPVQC